MIRSLKSGEPVPAEEPRRYVSSHGYVRLRWRTGKGEHVEVYEHRVRDGVVVNAPHVHHVDHVKDHNNPSNLVALTPTEHMRHHHARSMPVEEARSLYLQGWTPEQLGERYGLAGWTVIRYLRRAGVKTRSRYAGNRVDLDPAVIRRMHAEGIRAEGMARALGLRSSEPVRRVMRELDLPSFPSGRPKIHREPAEAKRRGFLVRSEDELDRGWT